MGRPRRSRARDHKAATASSSTPLPSPKCNAEGPGHWTTEIQAGTTTSDAWMHDAFGLGPASSVCDFTPWPYPPINHAQGFDHSDSSVSSQEVSFGLNTGQGHHEQDLFDLQFADYDARRDVQASTLALADSGRSKELLPRHDTLGINEFVVNTPIANTDPAATSLQYDSARDQVHTDDTAPPPTLSQRLSSILFDLQLELIATESRGTAEAVDRKKVVASANVLCDLLTSEDCGSQVAVDVALRDHFWRLGSTAIALVSFLYRWFCKQALNETARVKKKERRKTEGSRESGKGALDTRSYSMAFQMDFLGQLVVMEHQLSVLEHHFQHPTWWSMAGAAEVRQAMMHTRECVQIAMQQVRTI